MLLAIPVQGDRFFKTCQQMQPDPREISVISGTSPDQTLAELVELTGHPWFLACQFHPVFQSKPNGPHPLFRGFIGAALAHQS